MTNGRIGEQLFAQIMKDQGYIVEDVSDNKDYWGKDIDFVITSPITGKTKTFEVKFDSRIHKTGNLYLEFVNINSKGGNGWWKFCEADYLVYGDAVNRTFIVIDLQELRAKVERLHPQVAYCGNDSAGYLVNTRQIADISVNL